MTPRIVIVAIALVSAFLHAQSSPQAAFEVASVKRNVSGDTMSRYQVPPNGTVNIVNATLGELVRTAYEIDFLLERFTVVAPPDNALTRAGGSILDRARSLPRFDVQGKVPDGALPGQQFAMLRALLEERFKLRTHRETRATPAYALTVAREGRLGPDLRPSTADCVAYRKERLTDRNVQEPRSADGVPLCSGAGLPVKGVVTIREAGSMTELVRRLQGGVDRPIIDETGLNATFEWALSYAPAGADGLASNPIFGAVRDPLGLKLEPRTAPFEVLVIDSVEMPSEN